MRNLSVRQVILLFRRTTSSGAYIPEVDGLRFLSLGAIFIYHLHGFLALKSDIAWSAPVAQDWATLLTQHWYYAVPFFFAISGFVLGLPFAQSQLQERRPVSLRSYYVRRLTRLEPPYLVCLALLFIFQVLALRQSFGDLLPHLFASMFYLHGIIFGQPSLINGVAWTLEIEVQFYLLAPFLATIFAVRSKVLRRSL